MEQENNVVVVEDQVSDVDNNVEELSPKEIELAKKQGVDVSSVIDADKEPSSVKKEEKAEDQKKSEIPVEDLDSFEKLHDIYQSNPESFYKLPKNIKQLYHSQKGLYKRMKDEEEKRKKFEDDAGLNKIQNSVARIKLDRIKSRLANPDGLTVEELQELLDEKREEEKDNKDKPLTVKDLEDIKQKERAEEEKRVEEERGQNAFVAKRIKEAEDLGKENVSDLTGGKYTNFEDVVNLVKDVIKNKPRFQNHIASVINSDADVQEIVDVIIDIAKINQDWGKSVSTDKKADKESVDKLVKNASRQATSASLTGGRGSREIHISEDMDPEEALRVWDKIPRDIRHKILKKV
jgi:hypothetical protein